MPRYDYECRACEHAFEFFKHHTDEELPEECPECGSDKIEKLVSRGTSFVLKGSGWSRDGYS